MFTFTPKTEAQLANLLEKGEYRFYIADALQKTSRAGNQMVQLTLKVKTNNKEFMLYDYLMEGGVEYKIKHLTDAIGLEDAYNRGQIDPRTLIGKSGKAKIGIKEDLTGTYPPKNVVLDYLRAANAMETKTPVTGAAATTPAVDAFLNDDIPF